MASEKVPRRGLSISPSIIGDIVALVGALAVIGLSVADALKFYEADWYKYHQVTIIVCLLAFLTVATIVERRTTIVRGFANTLSEIKKLAPDPLGQRLRGAGVRNIYTSRADYSKYRGATELHEYVKTANKTVHIAAYWLSHGVEMEGIAHQLGDLVKSHHALRIAVAVVSPHSLTRGALASYLDMSVDDLTNRMRSSLEQLAKVRDSLPTNARNRFVLKTYDTLPVMSVIMLDVNEPNGKIQIDFKLYKTARAYSFGVEVVASEEQLYQRLKKATLALIDEATEF